MEFVVKKTSELTEAEKNSYRTLFIRVFKQERSLETFENQYKQNPFGYSYHSLAIDNGEIVASHTAFPSYYWYGDKKVKAYITGDTMVDKPYRDGVTFFDMVKTLSKYMKDEQFSFSFGFPNDHAHPVFLKTKMAKDIGMLDIYVLPYRIGGIKKVLSFLNPLSKVFCCLISRIGNIGASCQLQVYPIHKDCETYNETRYKRMDGHYQHVSYKGSEFYYKIKVHEGIKTAFLIDVVEKSEKNICMAVTYLLKYEKYNFDLLMYVGYFGKRIKKTGMIKIPRKFAPKHFYFTGKSYSKDIEDKVLFDINNWDVNLSDYDII